MMKIKIKLIICAIIMVLIGIVNGKVQAASVSLSANKTSVEVGDTITITAKVNAAQWDLKITNDDEELAESSELDNYESNISKTFTATYKATKAGTLKFNLEGDITDVDQTVSNIDKTVSVTVKAKTTSTTNTTNTTNTTTSTTTTASNVATLKTLWITPKQYDFTDFSKTKTSYTATVPYSVSSIKISAIATDSNATISGTGSKNLSVGKNTFSVKVTAEDKKTTKTYTITVTRKTEEEASSDATLKTLGITPNDFTGFESGTTTYSVNVPNDVSAVTIYATANDTEATVTGKGLKDLDVGENTFSIKVTAEDKKTTMTYTLKITREAEETTDANSDDDTNTTNDTTNDNINTDIVGLTNLTIAGYTLSPEFSNDVYEYSLEVLNDKDSLEIDTETSGDNIEVDIIGNEDLEVGENTITILVYNSEKDSTDTYQISVNMVDQASTIDEDESDSSTNSQKRELTIIIGAIVILLVLVIWTISKAIKSRNDDDDEEDYVDERLEDWDKLEASQINNEKPKAKKTKGRRYK